MLIHILIQCPKTGESIRTGYDSAKPGNFPSGSLTKTHFVAGNVTTSTLGSNKGPFYMIPHLWQSFFSFGLSNNFL